MYSMVFSGGSTKIPLHVGAYKAITEHDIVFDEIWGNSCGSIIAGVAACGMSHGQMKEIVMGMDFSTLTKQTWIEYILNILFRSGLVSGYNLERFLQGLFGETKFNDIDIKLNIMGHSLKRRTYVVFNKTNTPNMKIRDAVRISTAIPLFFTPVKISKKNSPFVNDIYGIQHDEDWYVDGGLSKGFPVDLVDKNKNFIGHVIQAPNKFNSNDCNFKDMALVILSQLMEQSCENSIRSAIDSNNDNRKILIVITQWDKPEYEFSISDSEKTTMMDLGYSNMKNALENDNKM